jgi:hypothetical protein
MGSCSIPGCIQTLGARHLPNTTDTDLTRAIAPIPSGIRAAVVAAYTHAAQPTIQRHSGHTMRALVKRGGPASALGFCAANPHECIGTRNTFFANIRFVSDDKQRESRS